MLISPDKVRRTSATAASSSSAAWRRRSSELLRLGLLMLLTVACHEQAPQRIHSAVRYPAPVLEDGDGVCADIAGKRACWRGDTTAIVPRALPDVPAAPRGFRCGGVGRERVCEDRARSGSAFECGTTRCLQERPRMPDDGEWECVEMSGVVFCHSRGPMAGLQTGPLDLGWLCGARRGVSDGERICVDLDPDRPDLASHRQCRFELQLGVQQRSCTPGKALLVGDTCTQASACPSGSRCDAGMCLPARPEPACWLDRDCGEGMRCALGTCSKAGA
jgi:hypothetical protein